MSLLRMISLISTHCTALQRTALRVPRMRHPPPRGMGVQRRRQPARQHRMPASRRLHLDRAPYLELQTCFPQLEAPDCACALGVP